MKTVILALDSLDYLILKDHYGFWSLKQEEFGWVNVREFLPLLNTPVIWASFLTGKPASAHRVSEAIWNNQIIQMLENMGILRGKTFLKRMGIRKKKVERIPPNIGTFLDHAKKPFTLSVPSLNLYNYQLGKAGEPWIWEQALNDPTVKDELTRRVFKLYKKKLGTLKYSLEQDYDLILCHFWLLDVIQHLHYDNLDYILGFYSEMDDDIADIKKQVEEENGFCLLISDHGQTRGIHNINAFYSSNIKFGLNGPKITDFYKIIVDHLD